MIMLPFDVSTTLARIGIGPELEGRPLQDAILSAIADRHGYVSWDVDHMGWRVDLLSPEQQDFHGRTLELGLAWCLIRLMFDEIGLRAFKDCPAEPSVSDANVTFRGYEAGAHRE